MGGKETYLSYVVVVVNRLCF
uniref:Uncharacterized protein n=1 Tax=Arundo donax TaxID=35708 RepID=A0A0A9HIA1_ARUDO